MSHVSLSTASGFSSFISPLSVRFDQQDFTIDQLNRVSFMTHPTGFKQRWSFSEVCDYTLKAITDAFNSHPSHTITLNRVEGSHILDFVDFGLPEGTSFASGTEAEKKQSWVYEILEKLVQKQSIARFEITSFPLGRLEIYIQKN